MHHAGPNRDRPGSHGDDPAPRRATHPPPRSIREGFRGDRTPDAAGARAIEILSHELRSPITTIHLGTKVLRHGEHQIPEVVRNEVVEAVEVEAERLYRLVEDLLAVARHEGDGEPLPVGPLLLQHWLPGVVAAEEAASPGLHATVAVGPGVAPVLADDAALTQVIRNLLANAIRYAPGTMPVEVVVEGVGDRVVIRVLDRGPGIDPQEAERLFEPFYRSETTAGAGSAAGLGLAAARRLLHAMGGSIDAWRRPGGGAEFRVHLSTLREDGPDD